MTGEFPIISSLDELIADEDINPFPKTKIRSGASEEQVQSLAKSLSIQLPVSLRHALVKLDLCSFLFDNIALDICIEGIRTQKPELLSTGIIAIGSSDQFIYYVSLDDKVYLTEIGLTRYMLLECNVIEFICRVATFTHPMWKAYQALNRSPDLIENCLENIGVTKSYWFWNMLASGAI